MLNNIKFWIVIFSFLAFTQNAYGYIDPGTATYILQLIIASLVGGFWVFRNIVINFYHKIFKRKKNTDTD